MSSTKPYPPFVTEPLIEWKSFSKPWHRNALVITAVFFVAVGSLSLSVYFNAIPLSQTVHIANLSFTMAHSNYFYIFTSSGSLALVSGILSSVVEYRRRHLIHETLKNRFDPKRLI